MAFSPFPPLFISSAEIAGQRAWRMEGVPIRKKGKFSPREKERDVMQPPSIHTAVCNTLQEKLPTRCLEPGSVWLVWTWPLPPKTGSAPIAIGDRPKPQCTTSTEAITYVRKSTESAKAVASHQSRPASQSGQGRFLTDAFAWMLS